MDKMSLKNELLATTHCYNTEVYRADSLYRTASYQKCVMHAAKNAAFLGCLFRQHYATIVVCGLRAST